MSNADRWYLAAVLVLAASIALAAFDVWRSRRSSRPAAPTEAVRYLPLIPGQRTTGSDQ